jgi:ketosteroid isomerase-like protein
MSAEPDSVAIVRSAMEAWNERDLASLSRSVDPALEWIEIEEAPDMGDRRGHAAVEQVTRDLEAAFEDYRLEPQRIEQLEDGRVAAVVRESGRGRGSGAEVASLYGYIITLREGRLARIEAYRDPSVALEVAAQTQTTKATSST